MPILSSGSPSCTNEAFSLLTFATYCVKPYYSLHPLCRWDVSEQENADDILLESEKKLKRSSKKATHAPRNVIVSPNM